MKRNVLSVFAVAVLVLTAMPLFAEEAAEESLAMTFRVTVIPGHRLEYEKALKDHMAMHKAAGDTWRITVWQVVAGEGLGDFIIRSAGHTWASLDGGVEVPNDREHFAAQVLPHLSSSSATVTKLMTDLSRWPADLAAPKMADVTIFTLSYQGKSEFLDVVKKLHKMIGEKDMPHRYSWGEVMVGASGPEFVLVFPRSGWADFAPKTPDLWKMAAEVYGQEEAQAMQAALGKAIVAEENFVVAYRPDLGYVPNE